MNTVGSTEACTDNQENQFSRTSTYGTGTPKCKLIKLITDVHESLNKSFNEIVYDENEKKQHQKEEFFQTNEKHFLINFFDKEDKEASDEQYKRVHIVLLSRDVSNEKNEDFCCQSNTKVFQTQDENFRNFTNIDVQSLSENSQETEIPNGENIQNIELYANQSTPSPDNQNGQIFNYENLVFGRNFS